MGKKTKLSQHFSKSLSSTHGPYTNALDNTEDWLNHLDEDKRDRILRPEKISRYLGHKQLHSFNKLDNLSLRNKLIFELIISTGCRISELQKLSFEDINFENLLYRKENDVYP